MEIIFNGTERGFLHSLKTKIDGYFKSRKIGNIAKIDIGKNKLWIENSIEESDRVAITKIIEVSMKNTKIRAKVA